MANLLKNGTFDEGHYHWRNVPEIVIPKEWDFWYLEDFKTKLERQDNDFLKPETVVWNKKDAPEHEKGVFFLSGDYCLKVFKGWGPLWWKLNQKASGLTVGKTYRFSAPVYPDLVMKYDQGKKIFADDMLAGEHRLIARAGGQEVETGWLDGNQVPFGKYTTLTLDFVANTTEVDLVLEVRGRWGLVNNGWFVDSLELEESVVAQAQRVLTAAQSAQTQEMREQEMIQLGVQLATKPSKPATTTAGAPSGVNLFKNGTFDEGHYHWRNVPEIVIPKEWDFWYLEDFKTKLERQDNDFLKPETVVWNKKDAPEHEKGVFFLSGDYCLKVFKGWGPLWWKLNQKVSGLTVGKTYRFSAPVYPDLVMKYDQGKKVFADDMLAGEHRLIARAGGQEVETGWLDGNQVPFGKYTTLTLDFVANSTEADLVLEVRGRWGLVNNGWFVDSLRLEAIG